MDLPIFKGDVKPSIKTTFAHFCTPLTSDKYLSLTPLSLTFDARQRWYLISLCALIKCVVKYVGDSSQTFLRLYTAFIMPHFNYCSSVWHFLWCRNTEKIDTRIIFLYLTLYLVKLTPNLCVKDAFRL